MYQENVDYYEQSERFTLTMDLKMFSNKSGRIKKATADTIEDCNRYLSSYYQTGKVRVDKTEEPNFENIMQFIEGKKNLAFCRMNFLCDLRSPLRLLALCCLAKKADLPPRLVDPRNGNLTEPLTQMAILDTYHAFVGLALKEAEISLDGNLRENLRFVEPILAPYLALSHTKLYNFYMSAATTAHAHFKDYKNREEILKDEKHRIGRKGLKTFLKARRDRILTEEQIEEFRQRFIALERYGFQLPNETDSETPVYLPYFEGEFWAAVDRAKWPDSGDFETMLLLMSSGLATTFSEIWDLLKGKIGDPKAAERQPDPKHFILDDKYVDRKKDLLEAYVAMMKLGVFPPSVPYLTEWKNRNTENKNRVLLLPDIPKCTRLTKRLKDDGTLSNYVPTGVRFADDRGTEDGDTLSESSSDEEGDFTLQKATYLAVTTAETDGKKWNWTTIADLAQAHGVEPAYWEKWQRNTMGTNHKTWMNRRNDFDKQSQIQPNAVYFGCPMCLRNFKYADSATDGEALTAPGAYGMCRGARMLDMDAPPTEKIRGATNFPFMYKHIIEYHRNTRVRFVDNPQLGEFLFDKIDQLPALYLPPKGTYNPNTWALYTIMEIQATCLQAGKPLPWAAKKRKATTDKTDANKRQKTEDTRKLSKQIGVLNEEKRVLEEQLQQQKRKYEQTILDKDLEIESLNATILHLKRELIAQDDE